MNEFVLVETKIRGRRWCVGRAKSRNLLEQVAERRRQNFPRTEQEVMTRQAWVSELQARAQLAECKRIAAEAKNMMQASLKGLGIKEEAA